MKRTLRIAAAGLIPLTLGLAWPRAGAAPGARAWTQKSFLDFGAGRLEDGGANSYVAADGSIQLVNRWDLNGDGYLDAVFPSSHDTNHGVDSYVYWGGAAGFDPARRMALPGNGGSGVAIADLNRDGFADVVIANEFNGTKTELHSFIYWGGRDGLSRTRRSELPTVAATAVAVADLDGDGYPELVFASSGRSYQFSKEGGDFQFLRPVSDIYWGAAAGYDPKRATQLETSYARGVVVADLDGDGAPDLVFADQGQDGTGSGALIYWGSKGGRYSSARRTLLPGSGTAAVAAADCNGDGLPDLVLANELRAGDTGYPLSSTIYWNGPGGFEPARRTELPTSGARDVKVADLDGDGHLDLVFACKTGGSWIYWGGAGASGGYAPERRTGLPTEHASHAAVADLDGDRRPDLVFSQEDDGRTNAFHSVVFWNSGRGFASARRTELPTLGAVDVAAGDLNGDGRADLVFCNARDGTAGAPVPTYLYWGSAAGTFTAAARQVLPGDALTACAAADLDNDGYVDLVLVGKELRIFRGSAAGFALERSYTLPVHYAFSVRIADFNRDGYLDLSVADWSGNRERDRTLIYWGGPAGFSATNRFAFPFSGARAHTAADFDGDGWLDLLFTGTDNQVTIFWNSARGFDPARRTDLPARMAVAAEVADCNRDGWLDIVVCNLYDLERVEHPAVPPGITAPAQSAPFAAGTWIYWGGPGGYSPARRTELPTVGSEDAAVADLNRDGFLDLVVTSYHAGITRNHPSYVFWGGADGISPARVTELPTESASGVQVADFNGDGWKDILFACHTEGTNHRTNSFLYWGGKQGFSTARRLLIPSVGTHWMWLADSGHVATRADAFDYISAPLDAGAGSRLGTIAWRVSTPHRTAVKFQVRSASERGALERAPWVGASGAGSFFTRSGSPLLAGERWVQYKATLVAPEGANSPVLRSVTLTYSTEEKQP
ncbi:MAG: hypothetical protein DMG07_04255 [Acidobacteria bacterium]|nr:MAG: hypothetical protein DMG07_04255 [Acidobacteriota bacterium]